MRVSVIIPAFNAARTIEHTIESLQRQAIDDWEAIVVDDGSTDGTAAVVQRMATADGRIRPIRGEHAGVSRARNLGLEHARGEWTLFLDSDDWIADDHLPSLLAQADQDPTIGQACCGWMRVAPDGLKYDPGFPPPLRDLFPTFARTCAFTVHGCITRTDLIRRAGGFDLSLVTCEDWDLWQRLARMGVSAAVVRRPLAFYRMRPGSASRNGLQMYRDGQTVIRRGHGVDPRVDACDRWRDGRAGVDPSGYIVGHGFWAAGLALGSGGDALAMVPELVPLANGTLDASMAATTVHAAGAVGQATPKDRWSEFYPTLRESIRQFFEAVEQASGTPAFASHAIRRLESLIVSTAPPRTFPHYRSVEAVRLEVTQPGGDLQVERAVDRVLVHVDAEGDSVGRLSLPVVGGCVQEHVLFDAIADKFAWKLLGRFFAHNIYPSLSIRRKNNRAAVLRDGVELVRDIGPIDDAHDAAVASERLHDAVGWTVLLQEVFGRHDWSDAMFYCDTDRHAQASPQWRADSDWVHVDLADPLYDIATGSPTLQVHVTLGGVTLVSVMVAASRGCVTARAIELAVLDAARIDLASAAVRQGVIGRPFNDGVCLRQRLSDALKSPTPPTLHPDVALVRRHQWLDRWAPAIAVPRSAMPVIVESAQPRVGPFGQMQPFDLAVTHLTPQPISPHQVLPTRPAAVKAAQAPTLQGRLRRWVNHAVRPGSSRKTNKAAPWSLTTHALPILMYQRVSDEGPITTRQSRVTTAQFEQQLRHLREAGYRSILIDEWLDAMRQRKPVPGRAVAITFDGGLADFATHAWPLLTRYGFTATVMLVAQHVGSYQQWGPPQAERVPLMDWPTILQLQDEGVAFGSHTLTHPRLADLDQAAMIDQMARSRAILQHRLGHGVQAIAYPYERDCPDPIVAHFAGACGYTVGFTCECRRSHFQDNPLALPRIEIAGDDQIEDFIIKLM